MFGYQGDLWAVSAALSLLITAGCAGDESGSAVPEPLPSGSESASPAALHAVADSFVSLGAGSERSPRWAAPVAVYIGGEASTQLDAVAAAERSSWRACPPSASEYAMRECPVSPFRTLDLLARDDGSVVYEDDDPTTVGCDTVSALPEWGSLSTVTIRPDQAHRDCFNDFAITLYVDDGQRIKAVNFTLSSP